MQNNIQKGSGQNQNNQQNNQAGKQGGLSWSQPASTQSQNQKPLTPTPPPANKPAHVPPYMQRQAPKTGNRKFLGILAGGILLGFIVGWAWLALRPNDANVATNTGTNTNATSTPTGTITGQQGGTGAAAGTGGSSSGSGAANVSTAVAPGIQAPAGDMISIATPQAPGTKVLITGVKVSVPTWIVVYEVRNGARGNALGAALFSPTSPTPINLSLLRATSPGQAYFVGRSVDDGDKIFSMQSDRPVVDASGNPIYMPFEVR